GGVDVWFLIVRVEFRQGVPETVTVPLAFVPDEALDKLAMPVAEAGFARIVGPVPGVLCDAMVVPACCRDVLRGVLTGRVRAVEPGTAIAATPLPSAAADD